MSAPSSDDDRAEMSSTPFDDFSNEVKSLGLRSLHLAPIARPLRVLSTVALGFAFASAAVILLLDALHGLRPEISWRVKPALPLIGIGLSYALLQFTLPRTWKEFCLGLAVSLGFILWGAEQFVPLRWVASLMDDLVVFLFVLDLSIVILGHLKQALPRPPDSRHSE